ncbi:nitronate monooxygenase [Candidatus Chloroploca sp. M-50]|uniref:Nitronate monooxygenase n=1 Tax=Candidatus Chloroploca mongolica TaxID=2528176 RepID=A0ABS4DGW4_9CHLR|nr:nitronate monooxygenase [Candidatus Chloroploca mongolica]MBP1468691.1 nitronate monooxygenase [Candidatus Chloroploca mongolica]
MSAASLPPIIQGGMGVAISDWRLARAVARCGQLGVVSGTGVDTVLMRRLQDGDPGGHMRRAMAQFPMPHVVERMLERYFLPEGRPPNTPYALLPMFRQETPRARQEIAMLGAFVEVTLAREGHQGPIGMNLLTKVQLPNLPMLYGSILAGVDVVLMGAGIPRDIPAALDALAEHQPAMMAFDVEGLPSGANALLRLDPGEYWDGPKPTLQRPAFLAIIASNSLATMLARKASGRVDGFVVEGPTAGGHNAPPRGEMQLNEEGEPVYGPRDAVDLAKIRELGLPFWVAGGVGTPEGLRQAQATGAVGIQVGTLFAFCEDSGLAPEYRSSILAAAVRGEVQVRTDPRASPTGYPFKVVHWSDDPAAEKSRERICDLGYLRSAYVTPEGEIGFRCASEPIAAFVQKGGAIEETEGRKCLCNALMANVGFAQQRRDGSIEPPLLTSGDDLQHIGDFLGGRTSYSAGDVIDYLLGER